MKKFSEKAFIRTGIIEKLNSNIFIKDNTKYMFYMWDYEKGHYCFWFRKKEDIHKSLYEPCKTYIVHLFWQHETDFAYTYNLICENFDKIEDLEN